MFFTDYLFYLFSSILVLASLRVITANNPVYSALSLVLAFFSAAGIWLLLHAEFLAIALVLVYVGAVMVLFLFVVMMLDINIEALRQRFWSYFPVALLIALLFIFEIYLVVTDKFFSWNTFREKQYPLNRQCFVYRLFTAISSCGSYFISRYHIRYCADYVWQEIA